MTESVVCREAVAAFCREEGNCRARRLGEGNINDTFLVTGASACFVLQRINARVFPRPLSVIENFARISRHLLAKQRACGLGLVVAEPVPTRDGALFYLDSEGSYWRGQSYLAGGPAVRLSGVDQVRRAGQTLARFHDLAADLEVAQLAEPLPGFHDLPGYLREFDRVLAETESKMTEAERSCRQTIDRMRPRASRLEEARQAGILIAQPIHGDPKIDNFIFSGPGRPDGMLDFDTVAGGLVHYDLGDCLRSGCNRAGEKGGEPAAVAFDLEYCRAFLDGYFAGGTLPGEAQRDLIFEAVHLIAFELGVRFFTDHLRGNTYFRVARAGENLARASRQFRLVEDIAAKEREIRRLVSVAAAGR